MNDYSSLRIEIDGILKEDILNWSLDNIENHKVFSHPDFPFMGREENTHCTILYNMLDTTAQEIQKVLAGEPSFEIELGEMSIFEHDLYDVFKINVTGRSLHELYDITFNSIDNDSYHNFNPHLTIAFMKKDKGKQLLERVNKNKFLGKKFKVKELCFNKYQNDEATIGLTT